MGKQADMGDANGAAKEAVAQATKATQEKASDAMTAASSTAQKEADSLKARSEAAIDNAKQAGAELSGKAVAATESGLQSLGGHAETIADRLRDRSGSLPGPAAEAAHYAASGIERGSAYLNQADVRQFVDQSQEVVKDRKVVAAIGIAVALLLVVMIVRALRGSADD
jgi:vacuolar-type H+-ATPase subunit H